MKRHELRNRISRACMVKLRDQVESKASSLEASQVDVRIRGQVWDQVFEYVACRVEDPVWDHVWGQIQHQIDEGYHETE
jgi:hypothetical protein